MGTPDAMRDFFFYHRRMLVVMAGICLAVSVALLIAMPGDRGWCLGFGLGAAAQLLKFGIIDIATVRKIAFERERAAAIQLKASFLSLVVFGAGLVGVFKFGLNLWAFAAGIFLPRLILIIDTYIRPNPFPATSELSDPVSPEEAADA